MNYILPILLIFFSPQPKFATPDQNMLNKSIPDNMKTLPQVFTWRHKKEGKVREKGKSSLIYSICIILVSICFVNSDGHLSWSWKQ